MKLVDKVNHDIGPGRFVAPRTARLRSYLGAISADQISYTKPQEV